MIHGTLEGLESSYDSPGIGFWTVKLEELPRVGKRFHCYAWDGRIDQPFVTGTVLRTRQLAADQIGFQTRRTTYVLRIEPGPQGSA